MIRHEFSARFLRLVVACVFLCCILEDESNVRFGIGKVVWTVVAALVAILFDFCSGVFACLTAHGMDIAPLDSVGASKVNSENT